MVGGASQHAPPLPGQPQSRADVEVDLVLLERPSDAIVIVEKPFVLRFGLVVSAILPAQGRGAYRQESKPVSLSLAVQHTRPAPLALKTENAAAAANGTGTVRTLRKRTSTVISFDTIDSGTGALTPPSRSGSVDIVTPRRIISPPPGSSGSYGHITPSVEQMPASPGSITAPRGIGVTGLTERLRRVALSEALGLQTEFSGSTGAFGDEDRNESQGSGLPPPYSTSLAKREEEFAKNGACTGLIKFAGPSLIRLPTITLVPEKASPSAGDPVRGEGYVEFNATFMPRECGFARLGGLRVLLLNDHLNNVDPNKDDDATLNAFSGNAEARSLREWDVIAELWVQ